MKSPFYMVVSSLPRMGVHFKVQEPPISRLQLEKRLRLLPLDKMTLLLEIEQLVWRSWFQNNRTFEETKKEWMALSTLDSPFIINLIHWYLDLRSIFVAIRMRNQKPTPPGMPQDYWITRWSRKLLQNWNEPDFGLGTVYPWLPKVAADLAKNDTIAVEEFLLFHIWNYLSVIETGHYFDFESLVIYLLRWNIVDYWSKFSKTNTLKNLDELCMAIIGNKVLIHESATQKQGIQL